MKGTCLILGSSGGIGSAIADKLAADGYQLLLHYHQNKDNVDALIDRLPSGSVLASLHGDLSNRDGIHQFIEKINVRLDNVVFANGESYYGLFQDTDERVMEKMISQHVTAPWLIVKHVLPAMITKKQGNIILISSIWGATGASCEVVYSSVKGAQNTFVKALAKETAQSGISVNGVSPGFIETKMNSYFSQEETQAIVEDIPVRRAGKPEEVADVVSFVISQSASYIHGEIINVTGAW